MKINISENELKELIKKYFLKRDKEVDIIFTPYKRIVESYEENNCSLKTTLKMAENILGKEKEVSYELSSTDLKNICQEILQEDGYQILNFNLNAGIRPERNYEKDSTYFDGVTIELQKEKKNIWIENLQIYTQAFILVDMVNGFATEGILHDKRILEIVPRQLELLEKYKRENQLIIFIRDCHDVNAVEFKRFGNIPHSLRGSRESELIDVFKPYENQKNTISIMKNSTSFMEAPDFRKILKLLVNLKRIDLAGCCTDICVCNGGIGLANYFDENNLDVEIYAHEDAIATFDEQNRQNYVNAAKLLMTQQGIKLVRKR